MYCKLVVIIGDVDELENHLAMNCYTFERIGWHFYVLEDEIEYVKTICDERQIEYYVEGE